MTTFPSAEVPRNFGYGIGLKFKEKVLEITDKNPSKIENNQTYLVYINVNNLRDSNGDYVLQISNNISIENNEALNLNLKVSYEFDDIV